MCVQATGCYPVLHGREGHLGLCSSGLQRAYDLEAQDCAQLCLCKACVDISIQAGVLFSGLFSCLQIMAFDDVLRIFSSFSSPRGRVIPGHSTPMSGRFPPPGQWACAPQNCQKRESVWVMVLQDPKADNSATEARRPRDVGSRTELCRINFEIHNYDTCTLIEEFLGIRSNARRRRCLFDENRTEQNLPVTKLSGDRRCRKRRRPSSLW